MTARPAVVHYTGHRSAAEPGIAREIAARIDAVCPVAAFGSLASGADILFAEAFIARRIALHIWLPFGIRRFQRTSVQPAGAAWVVRFKRALSAAREVTVLRSTGSVERAFAACTQAAINATLAAARAEALQIAVWNGEPADGEAGTAADVAAWRSLGLRTEVIDPRQDWGSSACPPKPPVII